MYRWIDDLFPICRSILGPGFVNSLHYLLEINSDIKIYKIKSGTKVFDWVIPDEWIPSQAYIENLSGKKLVDFKENNLHLMGYSISINEIIKIRDLERNLFYRKDLPDAIPYVTSYYKKNWGICLSYNQRKKMTEEKYRVVIKTEHRKGFLNYGEIFIKGKEKKEVFFSTYLCHPSMANNELSGPALASALALFIKSIKNRRFSYRLIFIPETIGSIAYIHKNKVKLLRDVVAGFNLTCVGDNNSYSFMPSKYGNTLADKVANFVLGEMDIKFKRYSFLERGSDERQYSGPLLNIPIVSIMRSKYHEYKEYHTSLDDMNFISPEGLQGSFDVHKEIINILENNLTYKSVNFCEPFLTKKNLYDPKSFFTGVKRNLARDALNFLAYADGTNDLIDISTYIKLSFKECLELAKVLKEKKLIKVC